MNAQEGTGEATFPLLLSAHAEESLDPRDTLITSRTTLDAITQRLGAQTVPPDARVVIDYHDSRNPVPNSILIPPGKDGFVLVNERDVVVQSLRMSEPAIMYGLVRAVQQHRLYGPRTAQLRRADKIERGSTTVVAAGAGLFSTGAVVSVADRVIRDGVTGELLRWADDYANWVAIGGFACLVAGLGVYTINRFANKLIPDSADISSAPYVTAGLEPAVRIVQKDQRA